MIFYFCNLAFFLLKKLEQKKLNPPFKKINKKEEIKSY